MNREIPHPILAPFISHYEFHNTYCPDNVALERKLCFQPETSVDFFIGDTFKKNKANAKKLILTTRALIRTPLASKNCMPRFSGHFISFSIKFHPTGLHRLLGIAMNELGNNSIPLSDIALFRTEELIDQMMYARHITHCINLIEPYLLPLALKQQAIPCFTELAAQKIVDKSGLISINELASTSCVSLSQLEKNFNKKVGISPKLYATMQRLFALLGDKAKKPDDKWSALAYEYGYHDPIHFTRDFNKYFSSNPSAFDYSDLILL